MRALLIALLIAFTSGFAWTASAIAGNSVQFQSFDVPGANQSQFLFVPAINDEGVVAGSYATPSGATVGFIRSRDGKFETMLMDPNDNEGSTVLRSINDEGMIAGFYGVSIAHGFLHLDNRFIPFDVPGAAGGTVLRGNNIFGDLSGSFSTSSTADPIGFIAPRHGKLISFRHPDPQATGIVVGKINDWRAVTGYYTDGTGKLRGFVRWPNGTFSDVSFPGADATLAYGINDCAIVAGYYVVGDASHGFFGTPGNLQSFDLPAAVVTRARGINNRGQLVGEYVDSNGVRHAYVTAPISAAACFDD